MKTVIDSELDKIVSACVRHKVARLDAFGSVLRDDFRPGKSDVDLLVEFKPLSGYERVDAYFDLLDELREILGTKVDLVMAGAVKNRYVAADISRTKRALYAA